MTGALPARYQRRLAPACRELMYVYDGDGNGVITHIATEYGTRQWVNPVLAKKIEVRASSPASRFTDPKVGDLGGLIWVVPRRENLGGRVLRVHKP